MNQPIRLDKSIVVKLMADDRIPEEAKRLIHLLDENNLVESISVTPMWIGEGSARTQDSILVEIEIDNLRFSLPNRDKNE